MPANLKDTVSKNYLSDPVRFAQLCNNALFDGTPLIHPEYLKELSTKESKVFGFQTKEMTALWKDRDILKMYQDQLLLAIIGIENQTEIHYCMPLRALLYDTLNLESQRSRIQSRHRKQKDLSDAEYVSGFSKSDRLIPVLTLVIYWGEDPWDGAKNLQELLDIPPELAQYKDKILDYRINLLEIRSIEDLEHYHGELKAFLGFLKYGKEKSALQKFVSDNEAIFRSISPESVQAMAVLGNSRELERILPEDSNGEEVFDMCEALREWIAESEEKGIAKGIAEEKINSIRIFIEDNLEESIPESRILEKLIRRFSLTPEEAKQYFQKYSITA